VARLQLPAAGGNRRDDLSPLLPGGVERLGGGGTAEPAGVDDGLLSLLRGTDLRLADAFVRRRFHRQKLAVLLHRSRRAGGYRRGAGRRIPPDERIGRGVADGVHRGGFPQCDGCQHRYRHRIVPPRGNGVPADRRAPQPARLDAARRSGVRHGGGDQVSRVSPRASGAAADRGGRVGLPARLPEEPAVEHFRRRCRRGALLCRQLDRLREPGFPGKNRHREIHPLFELSGPPRSGHRLDPQCVEFLRQPRQQQRQHFGGDHHACRRRRRPCRPVSPAAARKKAGVPGHRVCGVRSGDSCAAGAPAPALPLADPAAADHPAGDALRRLRGGAVRGGAPFPFVSFRLGNGGADRRGALRGVGFADLLPLSHCRDAVHRRARGRVPWVFHPARNPGGANRPGRRRGGGAGAGYRIPLRDQSGS